MRLLIALALTFLAAGPSGALPVRWSDNGHYYELLRPLASVGFDDARQDALFRTYKGIPGHLVTITSAAEQDFLIDSFGAPRRAWIGASDRGTEGAWTWLDGPEAGRVFHVSGAATQPGYSAWQAGEPNDFGPGEDVALFGFDSTGSWNDVADGTLAPSYIVEYSIEVIPAPMALLLMATAMGALAIAGAGRARVSRGAIRA